MQLWTKLRTELDRAGRVAQSAFDEGRLRLEALRARQLADRAVDLKTGTLNLISEFPNPNALLRPGQFGRVRFAATVAENAVLVPQKAVTEMQSAKIVYVVGPENKVQLRSIALGDRVGEDFIVTEGLKPGEKIIVEGIGKVRPGSVVAPTSQPMTSEPQKKGV